MEFRNKRKKDVTEGTLPAKASKDHVKFGKFIIAKPLQLSKQSGTL